MPVYNAFKNQNLQLKVTAKNAQGAVIPTPPGCAIEESKPLGTITQVDNSTWTMNTGNIADQTDVTASLGTIDSDYTTVVVTDDPNAVTSLTLVVSPAP